MNFTEKFVILDETYLPEMAELYKNAFGQEPWNDNWSDCCQLTEYIREISCSFNSLNYGLLIDGKLSALSIGMIRHWWKEQIITLKSFVYLLTFKVMA